MTHINRIDEMTNESLYLRIRPQSKNLFFAVVIGYDKNGNKVEHRSYAADDDKKIVYEDEIEIFKYDDIGNLIEYKMKYGKELYAEEHYEYVYYDK